MSELLQESEATFRAIDEALSDGTEAGKARARTLAWRMWNRIEEHKNRHPY